MSHKLIQLNLTSKTEDFPLLWEPMTVIWGRSWNERKMWDDTNNVVRNTDRRKDILQLVSAAISVLKAECGWTYLVNQRDELLIHGEVFSQLSDSNTAR